MEEYESILLVKPEVFVYKIPPRTTNRGVRAADWNLQTPDWTGRLRLVAKNKECFLKLEDKNSGELFARCPIDKYPGIAVEAVMDSSRYFVIRIQDDGSRAAFIGIGFADRGDSFDFNVALQDHFKWLQKTEEIEQEQKEDTVKPQLDLSFKEGQTITINMKIGNKNMGKERARPKGAGATGILLPPPPSSGGGGGGASVRLAPPPGGQRVSPSSSATSLAASDEALEGGSSSSQVSPVVEQPPQAQTGTSNLDLLLDLGLP